MRLVIAAGFAVAFTGCTVGVQTTSEEPDQGVPEKREATTVAPGPEIVPLRSRNGRGTLIAFEDAPLLTRAKNGGTAENREPGAVIVTLRSRNGRVTVHASEAGPLFTITKNDGTVEARQLSYVELQDRYPDHYRAFRNSIAADGRMYAGYYEPAFKEGLREIELAPIKPRVFEPDPIEIPILDASFR